MDQNKMWSLIAAMESIKAGIEGKKAANQICHINYDAPAYSEESFNHDAELLMDISKRLKEL